MTVRRVYIERLDLDLRGMSAEVAQAAVAALGPALATALSSDRHSGEGRTLAASNAPNFEPSGQLGSGLRRNDGQEVRLTTPRSPTAETLAATIAGGIARSLRGAS